jgi:hypothetical protein
MKLLCSLVLLAFCAACLRAQIVTPDIFAPTEQTGPNQGPSNGGDPYPILFRVTGTTVVFNCTITFSHPTRLVTAGIQIDPACDDPGTSAFTELRCFDLDASSSTTFFTLYEGDAVIQEICSGATYDIEMICGTTPALDPPSFDITTGSAVLTVTLDDDAIIGNTPNLTGVPIVDWLANPSYHIFATVTNTGCSAATSVQCEILIPSPLQTVATDGVIEFLPGSSTNVNTCRQLVNHFDCPSTITFPTGVTLAINASLSYTWALLLTNNGTLTSSISCTASRLGAGTVGDSQVAYGIGFVTNETSSEPLPQFESDNTDDLVINTIVPLSVFGGIMLFLLIIAAVTVGVYIFVKKVILSEENVGF